MQVWGSASPTLKRVWTSSREREVMDEWLDEVVLQNHAKMVLKSASAWPEKDREHKTKHARLHEKFWAQKRTEKKRTLERTALAEHAHELARLNDAGDAPPGAGQKSLYKRAKKLLLSASRKPPRENAALRAKVRRDARRASRSARCFTLDDGENLVWVMSQKQIERRREVAAAVAEASVQYDVKRVMALLRRESTGPALAELFKRGVPLSINATKDLTDLLERKPLPKMRSTKSGNKPGQGQARRGKGGKAKLRGTGAERHASSNGPPGKRRC